MKRSKRESNEIIIGFIFYIILVFLLLYFSLGYLYPKFITIEQNKKDTKNILYNISKIKKDGLDYASFKKLVKTDDISKLEMLKSINEDFYKKNLTNTGNIDFMSYLNNLESSLYNDKNNEILNERNNKLSKILPSYIEGDRKISIDKKEGDKNKLDILTNFKFINYLELLLKTFNLKYSSSLGISNIVFLKDYGNKGGSSLESNIFYIPLSFKLSGEKNGIINFLYYIENVGNIEKIKGKNDVKVNTNYDFLSYNGIPLVLEGEYGGIDYNIFEHQIADIESITTDKYLDSSIENRDGESFIHFIKKNEGREDYNINVEMRFYIKGLPINELEKGIKVIINRYNELNKKINKKLKSKYLKLDIRNELSAYNSTLKSISSSIIQIKKSLIKKEDLEKSYKEALKFDLILNNIENKIK